MLQDDRAKNDKAAVGTLESFIRSVKRESKNHMTKAAAEELIEMAREIIAQNKPPKAKHQGKKQGKKHGKKHGKAA